MPNIDVNDGCIVINTRLDDTGLKAGLKKLKSSAQDALNNVLFSAVKVGDKIGGVVQKISAIGGAVAGVFKKLLLGAFVILALSIRKIFASIKESVSDAINLKGGDTARRVEGIKNSFEELKAAIGAAFLPLVELAIPYIQQALSWLINLFNTVAQITAAFLGQKEALRIVQGSAQKIADANKKTEKAAKGQLAAFDQINVLQKQETTPTSELPKVAAEMVPVTNDILTKVQAIKSEIAAWWADPIGKLQETWGKVVAWFQENIFNPIAEWWKDTWLNQNVVQPLLDMFAPMWEWIKTAAAAAWEFIKFVAVGAWEAIKAAWSLLSPLFAEWWDTVTQIVKERIIFIVEIIQSIKQVFEGIITFLHGVFTGDWQEAWDGIRSIFEGVFNGIKAFIKLTVNSIIDVINGLLRAVVLGVNAISDALSGIQFDIPDWVPLIGGQSFQIGIPHVEAPQIPRLATGAVIPPNAQFAAILGDQKSGRNLEAPEGLIRQIIREEMGSGGGNDVTVPITLTLDGDVIYRNQQKVQRQRGKSLITGGATA